MRNTAYQWLRRGRRPGVLEPFDEDAHSETGSAPTPEDQLLERSEGELAEAALAALPARFREILVLREFEGLSYRELSQVLGIPMGTVMSTLSRARDCLRQTAKLMLDPRVSSSDETEGVG